MAEDGHRVTLNVYDLSQGLARQLSMTFLGKAIEAIWHTGVVVYGNEYYFGGGIQCDCAGMTPYGTPLRVIELGVTHVSKEVFEEYLQEIGPRYTAQTYKLLSHNCNNFSNEVAQFLVGTSIPDFLLNLPNEVMNSPMGPLLLPMIQQLESTLRACAVPQAAQFTPAAAIAQPSGPKIVVASADAGANPGKSEDQMGDSKVTQVTTSPEPGDAVPPEVEFATAQQKKPSARDPLGDARSKVQEEITKEFAAIMATGTLRASEAAALATRRVMERHGRLNIPMQQN